MYFEIFKRIKIVLKCAKRYVLDSIPNYFFSESQCIARKFNPAKFYGKNLRLHRKSVRKSFKINFFFKFASTHKFAFKLKPFYTPDYLRIQGYRSAYDSA